MIGSLHWTLLALLMLCIGCAVLNMAQVLLTRTVRVTGLLVCLGWGLQQAWWAEAKHDSLILMLVCDAVIAAFLLCRRASNDWSDWLILAIIPATMACYLRAHFFEQTAFNWWLNWALVASQMMLGLPRGARQRSLHSYSHGPLRRKSHGGA